MSKVKTKPSLDRFRYGNASDSSNKLYGLDDLCKKYINDSMSVLELGSYMGISTELLCFYAKDVVAVDIIHTSGMTSLQTRANNLLFKNIDFYEFIKLYKEVNLCRFDLIYIDGRHDYASVNKDIRMSLPLLNTGGFISGHDFAEVHPGVRQAVKEISHNNEIEIFSDSSWLIKNLGK